VNMYFKIHRWHCALENEDVSRTTSVKIQNTAQEIMVTIVY